MKFRLTTGIAALLCVMMASCYPYDESGRKKKVTGKPNANSAEEIKKKEEEAKKKAEDELKKKEAEKKINEQGGETGGASGGTTAPDIGNTGGGTTSPPVEPKRTDYAFATKVPGKEGFVFSPYNSRVVDVRDIPSGTLVQDPTYPASEKKYFRVP